MKSDDIINDAGLRRRLNTSAILRSLRRHGTQTLSQLAQETGLSRQTVEAVQEELAERGLVEEVPPAESIGAGRPARRFRFLADAGHVIGVDIGAERILVLVADLTGEVVAQARVEADEGMPAAERLALAHQYADACVTGRGIARGRVWAAAAGTAGVVDRTGRVMRSSQLPGWSGLDLGTQVGRWFGCPGFAANDANLAAVAEHWRGSARHVEDVVYVLTGHRAGHGLLLDGRVRTGRTGAAGELGKLPLTGWEDPSVILAEEGRTAGDVFDAARGGDPHALDVVDRLAKGLAMGASVMVRVADPELVVVGGAFSPAGELLLAPLRTHLAALCLYPPEVVVSTFGEEGIALGAIRVALDQVESERLAL